MVLVALNSAREKARNSIRQSDLRQWGVLIQEANTDAGQYPVQATEAAVDTITDTAGEALYDIYNAQNPQPNVNGPSGTDDDYYYVTDADGTVYEMRAVLEPDDTNYYYPADTTGLGTDG